MYDARLSTAMHTSVSDLWLLLSPKIYTCRLQNLMALLTNPRVRNVSAMLVERTITHPILPSGLAVISVYSGIVIHMKSYFSKAKSPLWHHLRITYFHVVHM